MFSQSKPMWKHNKIGPKIEPWGTPQEKESKKDKKVITHNWNWYMVQIKPYPEYELHDWDGPREQNGIILSKAADASSTNKT